MKKSLLVVWCVLLVVGCYREPTHPMQSGSNADQSADGPGMTLPDDAIHGGGMAAAPAQIIEARDVELGGMILTAPDNWVRRGGGMFIMTEFALPKAEGDPEDGRLTVSTAGGTLEMNIDRWKGQFGEAPEKSSQEALDVSGVQLTVVDFSGTFSDQRGAFAPASQKPGYRMIAAIIPLSGQLFFVKACGPEKTMGANEEAIRTFLLTLKPASDQPEAKSPPETEAKPPGDSESKPPADTEAKPPGDSEAKSSGGRP